MLTKVKDTLPLGKHSNVVYNIPCSYGQVYIEETKQRLEMRLKEHRDACERGMMEKSGVAEHAWKNHHLIYWEETTVLSWQRTGCSLKLVPGGFKDLPEYIPPSQCS